MPRGKCFNFHFFFFNKIVFVFPKLKWFYLLQNAVGGWWLMQQLEKKVVSGKVQTPSQQNSPTLSLSLFSSSNLPTSSVFQQNSPTISILFKLTDFFSFSAKLSHSFTFTLFSLQIHWLLQFLSKTLPLFHFQFVQIHLPLQFLSKTLILFHFHFFSSNSPTSSLSQQSSWTL